MAEGKTFAHQPKVPIVMSTPENLEVLYEDNHIIAVNKRSSDIVQGDITNDRTLDNVIREYLRVKYDKPGEAWLGTIHRIGPPGIWSDSLCKDLQVPEPHDESLQTSRGRQDLLGHRQSELPRAGRPRHQLPPEEQRAQQELRL